MERGGVHHGALRQLRELADVDLGVLLGEDVREAALGDAALQGHLTALEAGVQRVAGAGLLALGALARGLAEAGALAATEADTLLLRARDRVQVGEFVG